MHLIEANKSRASRLIDRERRLSRQTSKKKLLILRWRNFEFPRQDKLIRLPLKLSTAYLIWHDNRWVYSANIHDIASILASQIMHCKYLGLASHMSFRLLNVTVARCWSSVSTNILGPQHSRSSTDRVWVSENQISQWSAVGKSIHLIRKAAVDDDDDDENYYYYYYYCCYYYYYSYIFLFLNERLSFNMGRLRGNQH